MFRVYIIQATNCKYIAFWTLEACICCSESPSGSPAAFLASSHAIWRSAAFLALASSSLALSSVSLQREEHLLQFNYSSMHNVFNLQHFQSVLLLLSSQCAISSLAAHYLQTVTNSMNLLLSFSKQSLSKQEKVGDLRKPRAKKGNHSNEIPKFSFIGMHVSSQNLATIFTPGPKMCAPLRLDSVFVRKACNLHFPNIYTHLKSHIAHKNRMVKLMDGSHDWRGTSCGMIRCFVGMSCNLHFPSIYTHLKGRECS